MFIKTFVILLIGLTVPQAQASPIRPSLRWDTPILTKPRTEHVLLHCHGYLQNPSDVIRVDHVSQDKVVPIYTGSQINPALTGKFFSRNKIMEDGVNFLEIIIADLQEENAGEYLCYSSSTPHLTSSLHLTVSTYHRTEGSIQMIGFERNHASFRTNGCLGLRKGDKNGIECRVVIKGTSKAPLMRVFIDMQTDVTHLFTQRFETVEMIKENGLPQSTSFGYLTYETTNPDPSLKGKLTCKATVPDHSSAGISTMIDVE